MAEYEPALRNPMKGFREFFMIGTDRRRAEYPYPYGSLIKEYMQWNMLERVESDGVDKVIAYSNRRWEGVEEQNVKVIPRVLLVWVEPWHGGWAKNEANPDDLNGWHWPDDLPGETGPYKQIPGSVGAYVEPQDSLTTIRGGYFDPSFPERVRKLVAKLGEAWDNDPRVAYVEMGLIGEWGEHHDPNVTTVWLPHTQSFHVANRTWIPGIEKTLGDAFRDAFKNKKVMVRYAYEFEDYDFGIYWDSWAIDEELERGYNAMVKRGDYWRDQVVGGEITWNWGSLMANGYKSFEDCVANPGTRALVLEQIRTLHCNHLGGVTWANFKDQQFQTNAATVQKALGYRFVIREFSYPTRIDRGVPFEVKLDVVNTGSSPFYYDWPVEVALLDAATHEKVWGATLDDVRISQWMPGEEWDADREVYRIAPETVSVRARLVAEGVPAGRYILALGVLDPACGRPSLRFANTNYFTGGYHPLGYVGAGRPECDPALDPARFDDLQSDTTLNYKP